MSNSVRPHRGQPTRLPRPWDSPGKNTGVGCHFLLQCMKVKSQSEVAQSCPILATPWTAAYQAPPSMGFSRQKYWSGVPLPSPNEHHINVSYYTHLDVYNTTCDDHILSLLLPGWINKNYNFLKGMFSVFLWCILAVLQEKEKKKLFRKTFFTSLAIRPGSTICWAQWKMKMRGFLLKTENSKMATA